MSKLETTVAHASVSDPFVCKNCPLDPAPSGSVSVVFAVTALGALSAM